MICTSSFAPAKPQGSTPLAEAILFPSFQHIKNIPTEPQELEHFVRAFLLPKTLHPSHSDLSEKEQAKKVLDTTLLPKWESRGLDKIQSPTILICSHNSRDSRCGILGPLLHEEFTRYIAEQGAKISPNTGAFAPQADHVNVGMISHMGGHKWAGNVIVYIPPTYRAPGSGQKTSPLAGMGVWYGRVEPKHVQGIVEETILKGRVIRELFRGGTKDGEILRL